MFKILIVVLEQDQNKGMTTSTASNMDQSKEICSFPNDIAPKVDL